MGERDTVDAVGVNTYDDANYVVDNAIVQFDFASESIGTRSRNSTSPNRKPWEQIEVFGGYGPEIRNFPNTVCGLEEPLATGWDGYEARRVARAVDSSIARSETVALP